MKKKQPVSREADYCMSIVEVRALHRRLTEAEAWRVVARRLLTPTAPRTHGLCSEIMALRHEHLITMSVLRRMDRRIWRHLLPLQRAYFPPSPWDMTDSGKSPPRAPVHEIRAMLALMFALSAEEERAARTRSAARWTQQGVSDPCGAS